MTIDGIGIKVVLLIAGLVMTVIGLSINSWKISVIGNSLALMGALFA